MSRISAADAAARKRRVRDLHLAGLTTDEIAESEGVRDKRVITRIINELLQ